MGQAFVFLLVVGAGREMEKEAGEEERPKAAKKGMEEGEREKEQRLSQMRNILDEPVPHVEWRGVKADVVLF